MKPGYKQTEVGVIPEEWEVKSLGELATIATGHTPSTSNPRNYGDEFPFVGPVDLGNSKFISLMGSDGVSPRFLTLIGFIWNISHSGKGLLAAHSAAQCKIPVGEPV